MAGTSPPSAARTARAEVGDAPVGTRPRVVDDLRTAIITGVFSPNERLVEMELAERYGASRAEVRLALLELTKEGLVERPQNRGARVRTVTVEEAIEITEARLVNEGLCAAKAAERATSEEVAELRALVAEMRQAVGSGDLIRYSNYNDELHRRIREVSRHGVAAGIVDQLRNQVVRHQFRLALIPGRPQVSLGEHEAIVEAVAEGRPELAQELMQQHLRSVIDALSTQT